MSADLVLGDLEEAAPKGASWLRGALDEISRAQHEGRSIDVERQTRIVFARIGRALAPVADDARRRVLSWICEELPAEDAAAMVGVLLRSGGVGEQCAVLRALPTLPIGERLVEMAIDACRTNVVDVFAALAHDNTFPAAHFSDAAFNQLVLKAMFLGLDVRPIRGLAERVNPELVRMAEDYARERRAAGRPVPDGVGYIQSLRNESSP